MLKIKSACDVIGIDIQSLNNKHIVHKKARFIRAFLSQKARKNLCCLYFKASVFNNSYDLLGGELVRSNR